MVAAAQSVRVPQREYSGDIEATLTFPQGWEVQPLRMAGHSARKLSPAGIQRAFDNPIGCKPIREIAQGKKTAVVLFDDMSRPTRADILAPYVVRELLKGGIREENIQFICALGTHGAIQADDFRKKLGSAIIENFSVYNHNPYENCTYLGKTRRGTPVNVNTEFMNADVKIAIGGIVPHPMVGYGGGAKIILPGVCSIDTIEHNHHVLADRAKATGIEDAWGMDHHENNALTLDMQDTCRMSGLQVKVDAIMNIHRDPVALFVGEPIAEYTEGVKVARKHYVTPRPDGAEVIVTNSYAKANESGIACGGAQPLLPESGGTVVLISNNPYGEVQHYLYRKWGEHGGSRRYRSRNPLPKVKKLIWLSPFKDRASSDWIAPYECITWAKTWREVLGMLKQDYPGGTKVAVIPDGTIQYYA